jgi:hypothetical protein
MHAATSATRQHINVLADASVNPVHLVRGSVGRPTTFAHKAASGVQVADELDRSRLSLLIWIAIIATDPISAPTISKISAAYAPARRACRSKSDRWNREARRLKRRRCLTMGTPQGWSCLRALSIPASSRRCFIRGGSPRQSCALGFRRLQPEITLLPM